MPQSKKGKGKGKETNIQVYVDVNIRGADDVIEKLKAVERASDGLNESLERLRGSMTRMTIEYPEMDPFADKIAKELRQKRRKRRVQ